MDMKMKILIPQSHVLLGQHGSTIDTDVMTELMYNSGILSNRQTRVEKVTDDFES
jgi:hypothetical protein